MRYSPLVAADRPNGVWIEVAGSAHLFGGEEALLHDLTRRLRRAGVNARAAIADTPGAAWAVARHSPERIIVPGGMAAATAELPVGALRLPVETVDALRRLGVERIGQLAAMPSAPLVRRFGADVRRRLDQALGHAVEPFDALMPPEVIRRRLAFAEPIGSREALSGVVTRLCGDLCSDLAAKELGVRRLDLVFGRVDRASQAVQVKTAKPNRDPAHLARLLDDRLDFIDPGFGIEDGLLIASRVEPLAPKQTSAQGLSNEEAEANLGPLVDRLTTRLGEANVYRQAPIESDLPERSVVRVPALAPNAGLTWPHGRLGFSAPLSRSRSWRSCPTTRQLPSCGGVFVAASCARTGQSACSESGGAPTMSVRSCATTTASKRPTAHATGFSATGLLSKACDGSCMGSSHDLRRASGHDPLQLPAGCLERGGALRASRDARDPGARRGRSQLACRYRASPRCREDHRRSARCRMSARP